MNLNSMIRIECISLEWNDVRFAVDSSAMNAIIEFETIRTGMIGGQLGMQEGMQDRISFS